MNKTKIKNFSIWARRHLIEVVAYRMRFLGIDENGIASEMAGSTPTLKLYDMGTSKPAEVADRDIAKRVRLAAHIKDHEANSNYKTAYETVVEEIAYTWFNRLIAIRFMEVNDYLPSGVRVLSSESGKREPDIVTQAVEVAEEQGFAITQDEIWKLKDENKLDELFRIMFIQQCKKLHDVLPELFDNSMDDYTELLLPISFIDDDGFIRHLVSDIDEADFDLNQQGQVEIIGWLYQYYNSEKKDAVFAAMSNKVKVSKENIAAATQLFTPDWIVRYMVENSLGRLWTDGHPETSAKTNWKYYLEEAEQTEEVNAQLAEIRAGRKEMTPEQITFIDPCMGSGHILVYAFDVLMQIYRSRGYSERDAAQKIVRHNLWGLDLDKRAYQLAYFAVMMKARQYDRRFLGRGIKPNLSHFQDLPIVNYSLLDEPIKSFVEQFENADTYGSLITVEASEDIDAAIDAFEGTIGFDCNQLEHFMVLYKILSQRYDVVCTNPPYMASSNMNGLLNDYIKENYPNSKADFFACFIEKCGKLSKDDGYFSMITQHSWMFIGSYENLRNTILESRIISLTHLGIKAFEEIGNDVVQTCSFVMQRNQIAYYRSKFIRLTDYKNYSLKKEQFFNVANCFITSGDSFVEIPGSPFAYWVSSKFIENFAKGKRIDDFGVFTGSQNITGDNERFLRYFWEINSNKINDRWRFYAKGGDYRQYYGNFDLVVDWSATARHFYKTNKTSNLLNESLWFLEGITYSAVTSRGTGFRYLPEGCIFDKGGPSINVKEHIQEILALFNSNVAKYYFWVFNPSINLQVKDVKNTPIILPETENVSVIAMECTDLCQKDWDSFETSWDFKRHPLI